MLNTQEEKSYEQTFKLFKEGLFMPEISYRRKLSFGTIESHLRQLLELKRIDIEELLPKEKIELITKASEGKERLKEIKDSLPEEISYGEIKYVLTYLGRFKDKEKERKTSIQSTINTYIGNYCYRKCFNHDDVLTECFKKFEELAEKMKDTPITIKELKSMLDNDEIRVCKLPIEKRKVPVIGIGLRI